MGWLAVLSASRGRRAGLFAVAGVTAGLAVYMIAAAIGLAEAALVRPGVYQVLRWAGVGFLLWLAYEAWTGRSEASPALRDEAGRDRGFFLRGFVANLLNPKAAIFYVTLLPSFIDESRAPAFVQAMILGGVHLTVSVLVHGGIVMLAGGSGLGLGAASSVRLRRVFAGVIAVVAVWLALETSGHLIGR